MFEREVEELNSTWAYKYDIDQYAQREYWQIMKEHPYVGDCEDYALTLLYLISGKSMWKFWWYLCTGKAQIRRVITKTEEDMLFFVLVNTGLITGLKSLLAGRRWKN